MQMSGLLPETRIYGVKPGETEESLLDMRYSHTITDQDVTDAVAKAESLNFSNVRVVRG